MAAIDWLVDQNGNPIQLVRASKTTQKKTYTRSHFSQGTEDYLEHGGYTPEGERNPRLFRVACDFAGNQVPKAHALEKLAPIAAQSGLEMDEIEYVINSAYSKSRHPARKPSATYRYNYPYWLVAETFTKNYQWTGRTAVTDRMIMLALVQKLDLDTDKSGVFKASQRELAEIARCSQKTVQRALKRLQGNNETETIFIEHVSTDIDSKTFLWQFSDYVRSEGMKLLSKLDFQADIDVQIHEIDKKFPQSTSVRHIGIRRYGVLSGNSDAYERGKDSPGRTGQIVHELLLQVYPTELRVIEIADRTKLTVRQVYDVLAPKKLLVTSGLVRKQGRCWSAQPTTPEELDEKIASPAGNLGKGDRRIQRHISERGRYIGKYILYIREKTDPYFPRYQLDQSRNRQKRSRRNQ